MELQSIPMDNRGRAFLLKAGFTSSTSVLLLPPLALSKRVKLPLAEINNLLLSISQAVSNHSQGNIMDLIKDEGEVGGDWITTGDEKLDEVLSGGLRVGSGITEISGESSTGKSHLALQLSLTVQLPPHLGGQNGSSIYLTTESHFPSNRLLQLARSLISRLPESEEGEGEEGEGGEGNGEKRTEWDYLDNVHLSSAQDLEALEHTLDYYIPNLFSHLASLSSSSNATRTRKRKPPLAPKLLIIDSIAAPFRHSHSNNFIKRSQDLTSISDKLKKLSWEYDLSILVINQVTSVFPSLPPPPSSSFSHSHSHSSSPLPSSNSNSNSSTPTPPPNNNNNNAPLLLSSHQTPSFSGQSPSHNFLASLGHSWSICVNTRIMLSKVSYGGEGEGGGKGRRKMRVVFSPWGRRGEVEYGIEGEGVVGRGEVRWDGAGVEGVESEGEEERMWREVGEMEMGMELELG